MLSYRKDIVAVPNYYTFRGIKNVINSVSKITTRLRPTNLDHEPFR